MRPRKLCASLAIILPLLGAPAFAQQQEHKQHHPAGTPPSAGMQGMSGNQMGGAGGMMGMTRMMMGGMMGGSQTATLPEKLALHEKMMTAHLEGLRRLKTAVDPLYAALSPEQKKTADELVMGPMGTGMMM